MSSSSIFPATSRRGVLKGILASAATSTPVAAASLSISDVIGVNATAEAAYRASNSAEERLTHHLLMAGQAMDDLVPDSDCRWFVTMGGKAPFEGRFINAQRFQLMPDPEIKGLMIERMHDVMRWQP